jgi:peptidyl-prolyl cis-trans isomerase C
LMSAGAVLLLIVPQAARAQTPPVGNSPVIPAAASFSGNAALVNGEPVLESAVQRELRFAAPEDLPKLRPAIVNNLVDLMLIDQYLRAAKVDTPAAEVETRLKKMQDEAKTQGNMELSQLLAKLGVTETELRTMVTADLRWENFLKSQADNAKLEQFFNANKIMFDGSQVRGRHILLALKADAPAAEKAAAQAKLRSFRAEIEKKATELAVKIDSTANSITQAKAKLQAVETAFGEVAAKESDCPSKRSGGDLGWFPRIGRMVENFAATAFVLEPGTMSDVVETQFGYHLMLVSEKMPGKEVKFADLKDEVREVYGERLKQVMVPQLRQRAQITITPVATTGTIPEAAVTPPSVGK